ncbi:hypothetical protein GOP47_0012138 [Adiantum capillus-veneris]|uniref:Uncharacterized protein n=1 Tax=Adiantum capillus-veneris TaxID=13818 RepID=A0A9D4UQM1_ADICA|nr:hypothetical protein GOP47_0012138 [Adiantum capillus-veneris]
MTVIFPAFVHGLPCPYLVTRVPCGRVRLHTKNLGERRSSTKDSLTILLRALVSLLKKKCSVEIGRLWVWHGHNFRFGRVCLAERVAISGIH